MVRGAERQWRPGVVVRPADRRGAFDRPIVAGRALHAADRSPSARTVIVNEAFARAFSHDAGRGSPIGARLRYFASSTRPNASAAEPSFEIVGVVRDVRLDPDELGDERSYVFHAASAGTLSPLVMSVRVRGNPATLIARLPFIAANVDARFFVQDARAARQMGPAAGYELDRDCRSAGGGYCASCFCRR